MFNNSIKIDYMGNDALGEILIMLLVAFVFGWIARWLWETFFINENKKEYYSENNVKKKEIILKEKEKLSPAGLKDNNLKIVEGVGPKIEGILKKSGIDTWEDLSKSTVGDLEKVLKDAGSRFTFHDPATWPEQASLASESQWDELEEFQDFLRGGKQV